MRVCVLCVCCVCVCALAPRAGSGSSTIVTLQMNMCVCVCVCLASQGRVRQQHHCHPANECVCVYGCASARIRVCEATHWVFPPAFSAVKLRKQLSYPTQLSALKTVEWLGRYAQFRGTGPNCPGRGGGCMGTTTYIYARCSITHVMTYTGNLKAHGMQEQ